MHCVSHVMLLRPASSFSPASVYDDVVSLFFLIVIVRASYWLKEKFYVGCETVEALLTVDSHVPASLAIAACQARANKLATATTIAAEEIMNIFAARFSLVLSNTGDS